MTKKERSGLKIAHRVGVNSRNCKGCEHFIYLSAENQIEYGAYDPISSDDMPDEVCICELPPELECCIVDSDFWS